MQKTTILQIFYKYLYCKTYRKLKSIYPCLAAGSAKSMGMWLYEYYYASKSST